MSPRSPRGASTRTRTTFVDWLVEAGQSWWQLLPLHIPDELGSPYSSRSAFAGFEGLLSLPGSRHYDSGEGDEGAPQGDWLEEWVQFAGESERRAADALPARVAGAEVVRQRARDPADRRHPALRRRRLVRRGHATSPLRPLGRRGRLAVPEPSRGTALGHARVRLARARAHRVRLVAGPPRARARARSTCCASTTSGASSSSGSSRSTSPTPRADPGARARASRSSTPPASGSTACR